MSNSSKGEGFPLEKTIIKILWIIFVGWWSWIIVLALRILLLLSIVGIPLALDMKELSKYVLSPFTKESAKQQLNVFKFEGSPWKITLTKRDLAIYYLSAYIAIAYIETILFTILIGDYSAITILLNFSIWGITWLVSMFTYPMFFAAANVSKLAVNPYFSLIGYVIILVGFYLAFMLHRKAAEKSMGKKLTFNKLIDTYFPVRRDSKKEEKEVKKSIEVPDKSESKSEAKE